MQTSSITNWIPYKLNYTPQGWIVKWLDLVDKRMILPFFDETIQVCRISQRQRSSLESLSTMDFAADVSNDLSALEPSAFVFHVSRCGSTLLSQAFSAPEENIVIAEAPLLDEILRAREHQPDLPLSILEDWFRAAVRLMGQQRNFKEQHYIIKLDSWHIHFYELLRQWYPHTPFFFLYRKPDEVIASHDKRRGIHSVPGMVSPALLKTDDPGQFGGDFNRYTAQVLQQFYLKLQSILELNYAQNCFFDYADGVQEMMAAFSHFSGVAIKDEEQVHDRLKYHSKASQEVFKPESFDNRERFFFQDAHNAYEQLRSSHTLSI
ncbi:hypothetical protein [Chitinophaga sp. CF418]|uniref:hypothetical protein n=1 Tax=Chitinophaga sp. CF418 TaxID=1855287 RepID=UPI00091E3D30|nr:hypothetical protein [Chitinophaga sp. CF418]SHN12684.1 hypothetical protein SAMN05216311_105324 [Chitinophaga sp. CF418]